MFQMVLTMLTSRTWQSDAERDALDWRVLPPSMREGRRRRYR